jgi:predicted hotdog family 3-hydroxylacyl-ACP dehydratase
MAGYIPDIDTLLPHRPPFILVDRLLACDGSRTTTNLKITRNTPLVEDGRLTAGGLMEHIAQTAAAGAGYAALAEGGEIRSGAIVSVSHLEIAFLPEIDAELLTTVTVTDTVGDIIVISGRTSCGDAVIATAEMKILVGV